MASPEHDIVAVFDGWNIHGAGNRSTWRALQERILPHVGAVQGGFPRRRAQRDREMEAPLRVNYAIVFVSDMDRSVAFYRDVIGLRLKFESPAWTEFATEGATLALHTSHERAETATDSDSTPAGRCRPGLQVPDLDEFHQRMLAHGVVCIQNPTEVFGTRVAQYGDPDGLAISVGEGGNG